MAAFNFRSIAEQDLPEVAAFLHQQQEITSRDDPTLPGPNNDNLRWLLSILTARAESLLGDTLRDAEGKILGMIIGVPRIVPPRIASVVSAWQGATSYIDASARMQGFFMLRRFLATKGFDFVYANSCNRSVRASLGQVRRPHGP